MASSPVPTPLTQELKHIYVLLNELAELDTVFKACMDVLPPLSKLEVCEIQSLINLLESRLVALEAENKIYQRFLQALREICGHWKLLPSSYFLTENLCQEYVLPTTRGDAADIWKGTYKGVPVAIKSFRGVTQDDTGEIAMRAFKEVVLWKQLSHPNIAPVLGVPNPTVEFPLSVVSLWMTNGNMVEYLQANPDTNRRMLLIDVCNGIQFLHSLNIVHGNLKGANILINSDGRACLIDFGGASFRSDHETSGDAARVSCSRIAYRWMAPELVGGWSSKAADVYAFAMVMIEALSGEMPFSCLETAVPFRVTKGERPGRPNHGVSDEMWGLIEKCWDQDWTQRPTISFVLEQLGAASS